MRKKQLHIVNKYYLPVLAGIETCLSETYTRFSPDEWDITVHTSADTLDAPNSLPHEETIKGVKIVRYSTFHGNFFPLVPWHKADIVLLNNFSLMPIFPTLLSAFFLRALTLNRAKIVLAPHGGFTPSWSDFEPWQAVIKKFLHNQIGRRVINRIVDAVHAVADWEKEQLIRAGITPAKIYVIPNGVEDAAFAEKPGITSSIKKLVEKSGPYILTISRIHPLKNIEATIKSLAHVPNLTLIVVGQCHDQPYYDQLTDLVRNLGIESRVKFVGAVIGADKFYLIKHAVALVHMSRFEVDPLVVKECLSQGTICIGANNTGTARLLVDGVNGYLIPTHDEVKLAETVSFLIKNPKSKEASVIRRYNKDRRHKYRWNTIASQIELLFSNLLPQWSLSYSR